MTDGGPEFEGAFSCGLEQEGTFQHVCDAESPHQNGRCERHGGLAKAALVKASGGAGPKTLQEVEDLLCEVVAAKNRFAHRGGFHRTGWFSEKTFLCRFAGCLTTLLMKSGPRTS